MGDTGVPFFLASSGFDNLSLLDADTGEDRGPSSEKAMDGKINISKYGNAKGKVQLCVIAEVFSSDNFPYLKLVGRPMKSKSLDTQKYMFYKDFFPNESAFLYLGYFSRISMKWLSQNDLWMMSCVTEE